MMNRWVNQSFLLQSALSRFMQANKYYAHTHTVRYLSPPPHLIIIVVVVLLSSSSSTSLLPLLLFPAAPSSSVRPSVCKQKQVSFSYAITHPPISKTSIIIFPPTTHTHIALQRSDLLFFFTFTSLVYTPLRFGSMTLAFFPFLLLDNGPCHDQSSYYCPTYFS